MNSDDNKNDEANKDDLDNEDDLNWQGMADIARMVNLAISTAIKKAIEPLQATIENNAVELARIIKPLEDKIMDLKTQVVKLSLANRPKMSDLFAKNTSSQPQPFQAPQHKKLPRPTNDIQLAKRCLGFGPITPADVERHINLPTMISPRPSTMNAPN